MNKIMYCPFCGGVILIPKGAIHAVCRKCHAQAYSEKLLKKTRKEHKDDIHNQD